MIRKIAAITAAAGAIVAGGLATTPAHADGPYPEHVEMENFDVTFHGNDYPSGEGPSGTGWMSADVTVCAKNVAPGERVRVSWDAWSLATKTDTIKPSDDHDMIYGPTYPHGNLPPEAPPPADPSERYLADGECAEGNLRVFTDGERPGWLSYESSLGDSAQWQILV